MKRYAIIVAGGKGIRMGADMPKQFLELKRRPILMRTIDAFHTTDPAIDIIVVLPDDQLDLWTAYRRHYKFDTPHRVVVGGATRFHSVKNGLDALDGEGFVAIHDGVRPLVPPALITAVYTAIADQNADCDGVAPVVEPIDTLRLLTPNGNSLTVDRKQYRQVQTPQTFDLQRLKKAYRQAYDAHFTDDASVAEADGMRIALIEGARENIKITPRDDLKIAEALLPECST
jgi:2-C-methyl-D-erythritol 4-phosphate cytidylyltransferase